MPVTIINAISLSALPENLLHEKQLWQRGKIRIAGVDEAGRGPLAGPVVAAAVIFEPYLYLPEVNDSKKLSVKKRERLYQEITENCLDWSIGAATPAEIDEINIREATFLAMQRALAGLKSPPDFVLVDGYEISGIDLPQHHLIKGDSISFTIAAASIVAKVTRDRWMLEWHEKYPDYGFDKHKGYGTQLHREKIVELGLTPIHRKSFLGKILSRGK
ncbi:MAG: ribonuclease HII [Calditrichia bacterium]